MDEEQKLEPKISIFIAVFIGLWMLFFDIIELIPFVGDVTDIFGFLLLFYLYSIGVRGVFVLVSDILELIPVVQALPTRTIAWILTVVVEDLFPKKLKEGFEAAGGAMTSGGTSGAGAAGGAGAASAGESAAGKARKGAKAGRGSGETTTEVKEVGGEKKTRGRPSEEPVGGGGSEPEEGGETEEETKRREQEEALERKMQLGAEVAPEEELEAELFEPKDLAVREGEFRNRGGDEPEKEGKKVIDIGEVRAAQQKKAEAKQEEEDVEEAA